MAYIPPITDVTSPTGTISAVDSGTSTATGSNSSSIYTGTPSANSSYAVSALNYNSYSVQITGTWIGTLQVECSFDNGTTWYRVATQVKGVSNTAGTITANGAFVGEAAAANMLRVRATAWTSGTATIVYNLSNASEIVRIDNPIRLFDNTSNAQATIKPASTAPVGADTALVVTESPNSPGTKVTDGTNTLSVATQGSTTTGQTGVLSQASVTTNAPTYTTGQTSPLSLTTTGLLRVAGSPVSTTAPVNAFLQGINGGGNLDGVRTADSDGVASAQGTPRSGVMVWNGGSHDRLRSASAAANTNGTGLLGTGNLVLASTTNQTATTSGNYVRALGDKLGKQVVVGSLRELKGDAALTLTSSTTETTLIAAVAAQFNDVYGMIVTNTSATATEVVFRDVAAGTSRFSISVPGGDTRGFMLPEGGAYKQTTVNTAWTAQCSTSVASIKINALYVGNI